VPEIKPQPYDRVVETLHELDSLGQAVEKTAACRGVHRLDRQHHAGPCCPWYECLEGLNQEPGGMGTGMTAATAAMQDDHPGREPIGHVDRIVGIVEALVEGATIPPGEATRPVHARDPHPCRGHEGRGRRNADIRYFGPPRCDGVVPVADEAREIVGEVPPRGCHLTDRNVEHACIYS